jgi:hypothetical protein
MSFPRPLSIDAAHKNPYIVLNTNNGLRNTDLKYYASFTIPEQTAAEISTITNNTVETFTVTNKERLKILIPGHYEERYEYIDCIVYYTFERTSSTGMSQNFSFTLHRTLDTTNFVESNMLANHIHAMDREKRREFFNNVNFKQTWSSITAFEVVNKDDCTLLKLTNNTSNEYILPLWSTLQPNVLQQIRNNLRLYFLMELNTDNTIQ